MAQSKKTGLLIAGAILLLVVLIGISLSQRQATAPGQKSTIPAKATYDTLTTLPGDQTVNDGERVVIANGSVLTVQGDYTVNGILDCDKGPITLVVEGSLTVNGTITCVRADEITQNDLGIGIALAVQKNISFSSTAKVTTNGHVQIVDDRKKFATTQEQLDALYSSVAKDEGKGFRMGPFIEIPLAPGQVSTNMMETSGVRTAAVPTADPKKPYFVSVAHAQEPAVDSAGNTVRIGGTWVVGDPSQKPPAELQIPTPPKKINRIIVDFDFGGKNMQIKDFTLYGPDGRDGKEDTGTCTVRGGKGEDAYRLMINAPKITINNFTLYLGYGGDGGFAETSENCDPGIATGGDGGEPGNMKIIGDQGIDVAGSFTIHPGQGGRGGQGVAHGKKGEDGCAGKKGGDATATGGKGGNNKKGMRVEGNVSGKSNITISKVVGGDGGPADANGGNGGNGTGPGCAGGPGGKATVTGGKGGDATSRNFESQGGRGGDATSKPGNGGNGGQGTKTEPGGNGGRGGDAVAKEGKGGTGKTARGEDGTIRSQTDGDGGNGGDGCGPGSGGAGGSGKPNGNDGADGKNLCVPITKNTNDVGTGGNVNVNTNTNSNTNANTNTVPQQPQISVTPQSVSVNYDHKNPVCPLPLAPVSISGTQGTWTIKNQLPIWLQSRSGMSGQVPGSLQLVFPCQLQEYKDQTQAHTIQLEIQTESGTMTKTVQVFGTFSGF